MRDDEVYPVSVDKEQVMTEYDKWRDLGVHETGGDLIGSIADIYDDSDAAGPAPALVTVRTDPSARWSSFLPLRGVARRDGDQVIVPFDRSTVVSAPGIDDGDEAGDELTEEAIIEIYAHYGIDPTDPGDERQAPARWRKVIAREVVVEVVTAVSDTAALAEVLPDGVRVEEVQDAVAAEASSGADQVAVVVVHDQQVERMVDPEADTGAGQPL